MCPAHPIQSASSSPFPALCPGAALPLTLPSLITSKGHPCLDEQATLSSLQPIRARGGFLKQSLSRTPLCLKSAHSSACLVHKLLRVRLAPCPLLQPCPLPCAPLTLATPHWVLAPVAVGFQIILFAFFPLLMPSCARRPTPNSAVSRSFI